MTSAAKWLLEQGSTVNPVDRFFRTPLEVSVPMHSETFYTALGQHRSVETPLATTC